MSAAEAAPLTGTSGTGVSCWAEIVAASWHVLAPARVVPPGGGTVTARSRPHGTRFTRSIHDTHPPHRSRRVPPEPGRQHLRVDLGPRDLLRGAGRLRRRGRQRH